MRQFDLGVERVGRGEDTFLQTGENDGLVVERAVFLRRYIAFGLPEDIKHTAESAALAEIVMQVQQLIAAIAWGAKAGFDLFLVASELKTS